MFDKTGTLTHGKPEVTHVMLFVAERVCPHQLFTAIVGLAEWSSEHPLGVAITEFARKVSHCDHQYNMECCHHPGSTTYLDGFQFNGCSFTSGGQESESAFSVAVCKYTLSPYHQCHKMKLLLSR